MIGRNFALPADAVHQGFDGRASLADFIVKPLDDGGGVTGEHPGKGFVEDLHAFGGLWVFRVKVGMSEASEVPIGGLDGGAWCIRRDAEYDMGGSTAGADEGLIVERDGILRNAEVTSDQGDAAALDIGDGESILAIGGPFIPAIVAKPTVVGEEEPWQGQGVFSFAVFSFQGRGEWQCAGAHEGKGCILIGYGCDCGVEFLAALGDDLLVECGRGDDERAL